MIGHGKAILIGEYAVLHGAPALVTTLDLRVAVELRPGLSEDQRLRRAGEVLGVPPGEQIVVVDSDVEPGAGLGSSAALATAAAKLVLGEDAGDELLWRKATEVEAIFHGRSSGLDVAASVYRGTLLFHPGAPPRIERAGERSFDLQILLTRERHRTAEGLDRVARFAEAHRAEAERVFERLGELALAAADRMRAGRAPVEMMNEAHELLQRLGVSTPELDEACALARSHGAEGAKLTGAGMGGAVIFIGPRDDALHHQAARRGWRLLRVEAGVFEP